MSGKYTVFDRHVTNQGKELGVYMYFTEGMSKETFRGVQSIKVWTSTNRRFGLGGLVGRGVDGRRD